MAKTKSKYLKYTLGGSQGYRPQTVTAGGAPAPTAPPAVTAPDFRDATYNDAIGAAALNRDNTIAGVAGQQALLRGRYGFADNNFTLDPNNPFGQAQLVQRAYEQSRAGTRNSYAARGQQTSGAYGRMQGANLFNYQQRSDALQKQFLSDNAALSGQITQAQNAYRDTASAAGADALARALAARQPVQQAPTAAQTNASAHGAVVRSGVDSKGRRYNIHADGTRMTFK